MRQNSLKGWMVLVLLLGTVVYAIAEELTLTTYYPSPRGVYHELRTAGDVKLGDVSASSPKARLEIRGRTAGTSERALYVGNVDGDLRFVVQDNGNVGIGTASPTQKLHVVGNTRIEGAVAASYFDSLSPLILRTNGTERMRIDDTTGNVGIGTTSPTQKLDVAGQIRATGDICTELGGGRCLGQTVQMTHVTGTNPSCPVGELLMKKWQPKTCSGPGGDPCFGQSCTTPSGWLPGTTPTCSFPGIIVSQPEGPLLCSGAVCTADSWTEVLCQVD